MRVAIFAAAACFAAFVSGCASIESNPASAPGEGLVYYMPRKDIQIEVARTAEKATVTISEGGAFGDTQHPFVLNFSRNLIGKNELAVEVSSSGLLSATKSTTTAGIGEALKNLAASLGSIQMYSLIVPKIGADTPKCPLGSFTYLVEPPADEIVINDDAQICGVKVSIKRLTRAPLSAGAADASAAPAVRDPAGIYYRQEEAYLVSAVGKGSEAPVTTAKVVFSPSNAPIRFLPFQRSFFASNHGDFTLKDGMPQKYNQDVDGELVALFKIPADVIGAYFGAIGNVFDAFKANDTKQAAALDAQVKLELGKQKLAACLDAIKARNDDQIKQLDCGK